MELFSVSTDTISQHGRRGALLLTLRVDHPDIEKFISIKLVKEKMPEVIKDFIEKYLENYTVIYGDRLDLLFTYNQSRSSSQYLFRLERLFREVL